jgi:hypothetical protein
MVTLLREGPLTNKKACVGAVGAEGAMIEPLARSTPFRERENESDEKNGQQAMPVIVRPLGFPSRSLFEHDALNADSSASVDSLATKSIAQ